MGDYLETINAFFQAHHTTRKFVKGLVVFGVGFVVASQQEIMANLPPWAIVPIGALIIAIDNYVKHSSFFQTDARKKK